MRRLEEIEPESFTFDRHETNFGDALGLSYSVWSGTPEFLDGELHRALKRYAVGYCRGERLSYKPMNGFVGIMCEKDGERFWFHIMEQTFDLLFGDDETRGRLEARMSNTKGRNGNEN